MVLPQCPRREPEDFLPGHADASGSKSERGRSYETEIEGLTFRLNFDFQDEVVDATITQPDGTVRHAKGALRRL